MKWNNGEGEEGEEKVKAWWWLKSEPYFQQPIKSESNRAQQEKKTAPSFPLFAICKLHCGAMGLWGAKKKKSDEKQIKNLTGTLSWAETLIEKQNKMVLHGRLHSSYSWDIISASALNIIITIVIIIRAIYL